MKFFAIVIENNQPKRMYITSEDVISILTSNESRSVYRLSTDQVATIVNGNLMWKDIKEEKYVATETN